MCKAPSYFCPILPKSESPDKFEENSQQENFTKILLVEAEFFHVEGWRESTRMIGCVLQNCFM